MGIPVTPAVLAGVPVLVGLAVDYAVQLVARYDEARRLGADREAAIEEAMLAQRAGDVHAPRWRRSPVSER